VSALPDVLDDISQPAALADFAAASAKQERLKSWAFAAKGLADYRRGRFANAIESLESSLALSSSKLKELQTLKRLLLATAHARLGQTDEAVRWYSSAIPSLQHQRSKFANATAGRDWPDWLVCELIDREARSLIDDPFRRDARNASEDRLRS
jgi:tetratricopeptide (TPR) repeat protein